MGQEQDPAGAGSSSTFAATGSGAPSTQAAPAPYPNSAPAPMQHPTGMPHTLPVSHPQGAPHNMYAQPPSNYYAQQQPPTVVEGRWVPHSPSVTLVLDLAHAHGSTFSSSLVFWL